MRSKCIILLLGCTSQSNSLVYLVYTRAYNTDKSAMIYELKLCEELCEESTLPLPHDYCNKGKVCTQAEWPIQPELIWVSIAWNDQKYCYFPPWMSFQSIVKLSPNISSGFLEIMAVPNHTPDRRTVKVKCFIQEHNTIVRPQTWTTWPKVQCTDKQVTTSPTEFCDTSLVLMELNLALINLSSYKALSLHCE